METNIPKPSLYRLCQNLKSWVEVQLLFLLYLSCEIPPSKKRREDPGTGSNLKYPCGRIPPVCFLAVSQARVASPLALTERRGKKTSRSLTNPNISWTEVTFNRARWGRYSNGRSVASLSVAHAGAGSPTLLALRYTTAERSAVSFSHTCCLTAGGMRDE